LDGDIYNLIPLKQVPDFTPTRTHEPAEYNPAPKKFLEQPSTMKDVAEFVMEYINSDVRVHWSFFLHRKLNMHRL
jgi:RNA-dependent RNA polymerase